MSGADDNAAKENTMSHATDIKNAQVTLIKARALYDVLSDEVDALHPAPPADCDEATFEAWDAAFEAAREARNMNMVSDARTAAEEALIVAVGTWLRATQAQKADVMYLLDNLARFYTIRKKCLDLWMRLDTRTVH